MSCSHAHLINLLLSVLRLVQTILLNKQQGLAKPLTYELQEPIGLIMTEKGNLE